MENQCALVQNQAEGTNSAGISVSTLSPLIARDTLRVAQLLTQQTSQCERAHGQPAMPRIQLPQGNGNNQDLHGLNVSVIEERLEEFDVSIESNYPEANNTNMGWRRAGLSNTKTRKYAMQRQ